MRACEQRTQCLRTPEKTKVRQVVFFRGKAGTTEESHSDRMKRAIDSEGGRARYGRRFATVEPVFGNLRHNKRLDRFTLRGRKKVDTQWKLNATVGRKKTRKSEMAQIKPAPFLCRKPSWKYVFLQRQRSRSAVRPLQRVVRPVSRA